MGNRKPSLLYPVYKVFIATGGRRARNGCITHNFQAAGRNTQSNTFNLCKSVCAQGSRRPPKRGQNVTFEFG